MRKASLLAVLAAALVFAAAGSAITNGVPDGNAHPEVGALLATHAFSDGTWEECTGTLISAHVFLTAEHCDLGVSRVEVTFASTFVRGVSTPTGAPGTAIPTYSKTASDPHDLAVVVLDDESRRLERITPARLPAAGSLSNLPGDQQFTPVGYGAQSVTSGPGGKTFHYQDVRYRTVGTLNTVTPAWLKISGNPSHDDGNTCYGDSGGPNFLGAGSSETNIIAGTTITGDTPCRSTNVDYRLDTPVGAVVPRAVRHASLRHSAAGLCGSGARPLRRRVSLRPPRPLPGGFLVSPRRLLILCAGAFAALALLVAPAGAVSPRAHQPSLQFIGQAIVPTGTTFAGTTIGGLSSITYDPKLNVYYTLSDDQSQINPARFYTVGIDVGPSFGSSNVHFQAVTTLQKPGGGPYPTGGLDPEGLVLDKDRQLILTSEGNTNTLLAPFVREYDLTGDYLADLPVPGYYLPTADHSSGIRFNLAFESAGVPPDGRFFFTATENALFQDGPAATSTNGSPSRILRYNLQTGRLDREYLYETDPIFEPPIPSTQFAVNGIVELLPFNNELMLSMERSFSVGVPGTGNEIKLYSVALPGATNVLGEPSLAGKLGSIRPAQKTLLLDLGTLGIPLDNVEGMTWGPKLPDGRQSLVMVSDNNFAASQFTQFLLFAVSP